MKRFKVTFKITPKVQSQLSTINVILLGKKFIPENKFEEEENFKVQLMLTVYQWKCNSKPCSSVHQTSGSSSAPSALHFCHTF